MSESNITTEPGASKDLPREEDKVESLDRGGQGARAYLELERRALHNAWPIPDKTKAKAILIANQDLNHPSARVRAAAARNLAMFDRLNVSRESIEVRRELARVLTEQPVLTIEAILANSEALAQERRLLAQERASAVNGSEEESDEIPPIGLG